MRRRLPAAIGSADTKDCGACRSKGLILEYYNIDLNLDFRDSVFGAVSVLLDDRAHYLGLGVDDLLEEALGNSFPCDCQSCTFHQNV